MKPKLKEFIPIYGMMQYFKRYFKQNRTTSEDSLTASWMQVYHMVLALIIFMPILIWLLRKTT